MMPFSKGSRMCPGMKYVYLKITYRLSNRYRNAFCSSFAVKYSRLSATADGSDTAWRTRNCISYWEVSSANSR